ncbi:C1 family peptidase [Roseovarius sp. Pro17]|uniref:C1 family peptidase n=1 Tax=Roseovarius sp. Pro17 TaxID=3108175 RepID=UPI002D78DADC|nr:C1 family peptidase [Roseovarius sp. Pro17]
MTQLVLPDEGGTDQIKVSPMPQPSQKDRVLRADPTDLRDRFFEPSLNPLGAESEPALVGRICSETHALPYHLRDQGTDGTCAGQALANLIDMHRIRALGARAERPAPVSARMLYQMGVQQERGPGATGPVGVTSLRSVIKGFYHNGVCPEAAWPDKKDETVLSPDRAKGARGTTLGAYYRVRSYLNDYHAALSEADCIFVSATTHRGWHKVTDGAIPTDPTPAENHAFVAVGYNDRGFLVLNSWGRDWGGYRSEGQLLHGVALWSYEDWSINVLDAWVLRLGVPSPEAFTYSHSRRGIFFDDGPLQAGSAPSHQLLGHFAHLDDGDHVTGGSYASSRSSVALTAGRMAAKPDRPVHISLPGSLLGIGAAFLSEVRRRPALEDGLGMYPYTLFWCNDMVESTTSVLAHLFDTAVEKVGVHSPDLNDEIEVATSGIGRAFWRDIKRAARRAGHHAHMHRPAVTQDGAAAELFDHFAATGAKLHLTADGAGVLLLEQYLLSLHTGGPGKDIAGTRRAFFDVVSSLTLIAPTIRADDFAAAFGPLVAELAARKPIKDAARVTLWVPSWGFERKLTVGHYSRSILDLVLYGFEGADKARDRFIGMSAKRWGAAQLTEPGGLLAGVDVRKIKTPDHAKQPAEERRRRYTQAHVIAHKESHAQILANLQAIISEDSQQKDESHDQDHT